MEAGISNVMGPAEGEESADSLEDDRLGLERASDASRKRGVRYAGVTYHKSAGKYLARKTVGGVKRHFGNFEKQFDGALAIRAAVLREEGREEAAKMIEDIMCERNVKVWEKRVSKAVPTAASSSSATPKATPSSNKPNEKETFGKMPVGTSDIAWGNLTTKQNLRVASVLRAHPNAAAVAAAGREASASVTLGPATAPGTPGMSVNPTAMAASAGEAAGPVLLWGCPACRGSHKKHRLDKTCMLSQHSPGGHGRGRGRGRGRGKAKGSDAAVDAEEEDAIKNVQFTPPAILPKKGSDVALDTQRDSAAEDVPLPPPSIFSKLWCPEEAARLPEQPLPNESSQTPSQLLVPTPPLGPPPGWVPPPGWQPHSSGPVGPRFDRGRQHGSQPHSSGPRQRPSEAEPLAAENTRTPLGARFEMRQTDQARWDAKVRDATAKAKAAIAYGAEWEAMQTIEPCAYLTCRVSAQEELARNEELEKMRAWEKAGGEEAERRQQAEWDYAKRRRRSSSETRRTTDPYETTM